MSLKYSRVVSKHLGMGSLILGKFILHKELNYRFSNFYSKLWNILGTFIDEKKKLVPNSQKIYFLFVSIFQASKV